MLKVNAIIAAAILIIPAILFYPLKNSITGNEYTSFLKWICLLGPVFLIVFAIQSAKSESFARKFLPFFVTGLVLFLGILAPSSGVDLLSAKVILAVVFCFMILGTSVAVEFFRFKLLGHSQQSTGASNILSAVVPAVIVSIAYLYDADLLLRDRIETHWFAYLGLGASVFFNDAVFQYFRESFAQINTQPGTSIFILLNSFLWIFFSVLFVLV